MKRISFYLSAVLLIGSAAITRPAFAQTQTPPVGPTGAVSGTIIDQNTASAVGTELDIMLHLLDQDFTEKDMLHGRSQSDGTFLFNDVLLVRLAPLSPMETLMVWPAFTFE